MTLDDFAATFMLNAAEKQFLVEHHFDAAMAQFQGCPDFVQPEVYEPLLDKLRRHGQQLKKLLAPVSTQLRSDERLQRFCHLIHYLWYSGQEDIPGYTSPLPKAETLLGEQGGLVNCLIALSAYPLWLEAYRRLGVPASYADDCLQYFDGAIDEYRSGHNGVFGLAPTKLNWIRFYVRGKLFRIGRFEYMLQEPLTSLPAVYRDQMTGHVVALCRPDWRLRGDGLIQWRDEDPADARLVTRLENSTGQVKGTPIDPRGFALVDQTIELDLKRYAPLFAPWDLVPGLHIPGGGGMTPDLCAESFRQAKAFFREYFHRDIPAISCFSWIFNPDFEAELPESNLSRLMRELYLFPFPSSGLEGLQFVFGRSDSDWSGYPRDNSLRQAFHRIRESGRRLKAGGMVIDDFGIRHFGAQYYRRQPASGMAPQS